MPSPSRWSWLRQAWENQHPEEAAERAARQFELRAVPLPVDLAIDDSAPPYLRRIHSDAAHLYQVLVITSGAGGLTLSELFAAGELGTDRHRQALKRLRSSESVSESRQQRANQAGTMQVQVVLQAMGTSG